jgi:hypothetical protein
MWNYDEEEPTPLEVATDRVVIGTIYLVLVGALLSGIVHLIAS